MGRPYDRRRSRSNERPGPNNHGQNSYRPRSRSGSEERNYGGMKHHGGRAAQGGVPSSGPNHGGNQQHSGENSIHQNYHGGGGGHQKSYMNENGPGLHSSQGHYNENRGGPAGMSGRPNMGGGNTSNDHGGGQSYQGPNKFTRQYSDSYRKSNERVPLQKTASGPGQYAPRGQREDGNGFHNSGSGYGADP